MLESLFFFALSSLGPGAALQLADAVKERARALTLEERSDWPSALLAWERVLDRCEASVAQRGEALRRVKDLRQRISSKEAQPETVRTWRAIFLIFESLDLATGKGTPGERSYRTEMSREDLERIERSVGKFCEQALRSTSGIVRIVPEIVRVKEPLRSLAGDARGGFWLDPQRALPFVPAQTEVNPYESVFTFVKMVDDKGKQLPIPFFAGTYGGDAGVHGAGYTAICWGTGDADEGELEFHEWMHQADWMFSAVLGYPDEFVPNPDAERCVEGTPADPCYRRTPGEKSRLNFHRHIAEEHVTRLMWSEAGMFEAPTSPIQPRDIRRWLLLGPFRAEEGAKALLHPFLDEAAARPKEGDSVGEKKWLAVAHEDRALDLGKSFGDDPGLAAYAFVRVRAPEPMDAKLWLGSDDGVRVWANGKLVHSVDLSRVMQLDLDRVSIRLEKGWNALLFKVDNRGGGWSLQARLVDAEGRALRGLELD